MPSSVVRSGRLPVTNWERPLRLVKFLTQARTVPRIFAYSSSCSPLTPEAASAMAVLALSADLESWATRAADVAGRIGVIT
jgi:hypothetical protein